MKQVMTRSLKLLALGAVFVAPSMAVAKIALDDEGKFNVYGDFRARIESDWNSHKASGSLRDDRTRARIRVRLGFEYKPTNNLEFGIRGRSGSNDSQQSPHITIIDFNKNNTGDAHFNLDKWYLKYKISHFSVWIGRNGLPLWKQNEMLIDDDVTPVGGGVSTNMPLGETGKITVNGGYFSLPVGMRAFSGNLALGQAVFTTKTDGVNITVAGGVLAFKANGNDPDSIRLLRGNGNRNYTVWTASAQAKFKAGGHSLKVGFDYYHNSEKYSPMDLNATTAANFDQRDGWVGSMQVGNLKKTGDWLARYTYAYIETFAVNSSYAQDDWVRWGSAVETRGSNMKGHEFRVGYKVSGSMNLIARLYIAKANTNVEDGNRFRLDLNYKF